MHVGGRAESVMVGRVVRGLRAGEDGGMVVLGPAGVGRTHLLRQASSAVRAAGAPVISVTATRASAAIPFGALAELVPAGTSLGDHLATFLAVAGAVAERAGGERPLLAIDDAHLLDPAAAAVVLHLAHTRQAYVLATAVPGHPGTDAVVSLWKDGVAQRVDLTPLDEDAAAAMAAELLGGPLDGAGRRAVFELTSGFPRLVREVVEEAVALGTLDRVGSVWTVRGRLDPGPRALQQAEARLAALTAAEREALEPLALAGHLGLACFERLAGEHLARSLERDGLVTVQRRRRRLEALVADPLLAVALLAHLPAGIAARIRRDLRGVLEAYGPRRHADVAQVATWHLEERGEGDPMLLVSASRVVDDHRQAERLARAALAAGGGLPAAIGLAAALVGQQRFTEAEGVLAGRAGDVADARDEDAAAALHLHVRAVLGSCGRPGDALAVVAAAERQRPHDRGLPATAGALRAWILHVGHQRGEAVRHARAALVDPEAPREATELARRTLALALAFDGRPQAAAESATGADGPWPLALARLLDGDLDGADQLSADAYQPALEAGDDDARALMALVLGWSSLMRGAIGAAQRWLSEAAAVLRRSDPQHQRVLCLSLLTAAHALAGDAEAARTARDAVAASTGDHGADLAYAEVWTAAVMGRGEDAVRRALAAAETPGIRPFLRARLLHDALRLGCPPCRVAGSLRETVDGVDAAWAAVLAEQAEAAAAGDAAGVARAAAALEDLGMLLLAAEAHGMAATLHAAAGRPHAAGRADAAAGRLLARCDGARSAPRHDGALRAALTSREREVAELAATGLTSTDVARRLVVSVRTVESHLYNAYGKLGIGRRAELAAALSGRRP